jgi:hypothetical protein
MASNHGNLIFAGAKMKRVPQRRQEYLPERQALVIILQEAEGRCRIITRAKSG